MRKAISAALSLLVSCTFLFLSVSCGPEDGPVAPVPSDSTGQTTEPRELLLGPSHDTVFEAGGVAFSMIYVPSGSFTMGATTSAGSDSYDPDADQMEQPPHRVYLDAFLIADVEVSQFLYFAVMGSNPSQFSDLTLPVHNVSFAHAQQFLDSLSALTGYKFRLPTEAEWEFAAKGGGIGSGYFSGSDAVDSVGWSSQNSEGQLHQSALLKPNILGLYDMTGNVREWCSDWYGTYPSTPQNNPQGPEMPTNANNQKRVVRGGSYQQAPYYLRNTARQFLFGSSEPSDLGLRVVMSVR